MRWAFHCDQDVDRDGRDPPSIRLTAEIWNQSPEVAPRPRARAVRPTSAAEAVGWLWLVAPPPPPLGYLL